MCFLVSLLVCFLFRSRFFFEKTKKRKKQKNKYNMDPAPNIRESDRDGKYFQGQKNVSGQFENMGYLFGRLIV